jgi:hypothetical protein
VSPPRTTRRRSPSNRQAAWRLTPWHHDGPTGTKKTAKNDDGEMEPVTDHDRASRKQLRARLLLTSCFSRVLSYFASLRWC